LQALSLFTGAGGLDLGLEAAGFEIAGCVEREADSRATIAQNTSWRLAREGDVERVTAKDVLEEFGIGSGELTLLAGGPPCQPFSKSGQWRTGATMRMEDPRARTLSAFFGYLDAALPKLMVLENVKGLTAKPRAGSPGDEAMQFLHDSLEVVNSRWGTNYLPAVIHLDAAHYGVPQKRERVFVVASRDGAEFSTPPPTHSTRIEDGLPRLTNAWDAIGDLDFDVWDASLSPSGVWGDLLGSIPEGKNYLHHTPKGLGEPLFGWRTKYWSFLLKLAKAKPSWTIQAQPGPATGPFHWRSRKLSVRELARLQTFPDEHVFHGSFHSARRQIGNAVPVALAEVLGLELRRQLLGHRTVGRATLSTPHRDDCPPEEIPSSVPGRYRSLVAAHSDHPGPGLGPGATR
jgi:DNA (cytosine-5)-methyltransferase 1